MRDVSEQLDLNRDGRISKEEFLESFVSNGEFMDLVQCVRGEDIWGDLLLGLCATDVECATWWWPLRWEHVPWPQFWWWWCVAKAAGSETVLFSTGLLIEPAEPLSLEATRELLEWTWCEEVAIDAGGAYPFEEADLAVNRSRILSRLLPLDPSLALRLARLLASCPLPRLWLL